MRRLPAVAIAAVSTLALMEIGARALRLAPELTSQHAANVPDPVLPYKRRPGSVLRGRSRSGEYEFVYRHNALGFRDREHGEAKPAGVLRIVALGDSFTYGEGAAFDETWVARLEALLDERDDLPEVETIRLGLPRYFPAASRIALEHVGLRFDPDVVIVAVLPNDVIDTHLGIEEIAVDPSGFLTSRAGRRLGAPGRWLYETSHLARLALRRWAAYERQRISPFVWRDVYRAGGAHEDDWRALERDLEGILETTRAAGAELVVLSIPQQGPWQPRHAYPDERLGAWSERHAAHFVAALPALEAASAAGGERLFWERDGHCTPAGYAVIASALAEALLASDLLPRLSP